MRSSDWGIGSDEPSGPTVLCTGSGFIMDDYGHAVTAGTAYTMSYQYTQQGVTRSSMTWGVVWFDASGTYITQAGGNASVITDSNWHLKTLSGTVHASAFYAIPYWFPGVTGNVTWLDDFSFVADGEQKLTANQRTIESGISGFNHPGGVDLTQDLSVVFAGAASLRAESLVTPGEFVTIPNPGPGGPNLSGAWQIIG